jgi:predicted LPLAT superfamily acyltransferase
VTADSEARLAPDSGAAVPHWSDLRERGTILGMRVVLVARWLLGRRLCHALLYLIVGYFYLTDPKRRFYTRQYLARIRRLRGESEPGWRDGLRLHVSFAEKMLDTVMAWQDPRRAGAFTTIGAELIEQRRDAGAGGLLIVSHLGNAELCRPALTERFGREISILVHTKHALQYNELVARACRSAPARMIQVTETSPATAIDLQERIERGEWIAIAGDRTPVTGDGMRTAAVPFLGELARFPQGPYLLAAVIGCPVYLLFCLRDGIGHRVIFEPFADRIVLPRRDKAAALTALAARYAARLEHHCLQAPEQWYNFFDFWA